MEELKFKCLTDKQKDLILALHKSELTSRQIALVVQCAQSTVIRQVQKFQQSGQLPMTERRKATRYPAPAYKIYEDLKHTMFKTVRRTNEDNTSNGKTYISHKKNPIDEPINSNQSHLANIAHTKMMEVKHSPAGQMEFRTTRNGLSDQVEKDLDDLFDEDVTKSLTPPSDDCNTKATPLNGINKNLEAKNTTDTPGGVKTDLDKNGVESSEKVVEVEDTKVKNETTEDSEETKPEIDLFELDLESVSTAKAENGENVVDASKVRDTGDDLDTLLSKINDLVEDCMEPKADGTVAVATATNEVVEIQDDDTDDVSNETTETSTSGRKTGSTSETEVEESDTIPAEASEKIPEEKMEIDDDVVCLDSPLPDSNKEDNLMLEEEIRTISEPNEVGQQDPAKKEEILEKVVEEEENIEKVSKSTAVAVSEQATAMEDDEVYLIEDDDDVDEPTKEVGIQTKNMETEDVSEEPPKEAIAETEKIIDETSEPLEKQQTVEDKSSTNNDEDDDDIVCLDDSFEDCEDKAEEAEESGANKTTEETLTVGEEKEKQVEDSEKVSEKVPQSIDEPVLEKDEEESVTKELDKDAVTKEVEEKEEQVAKKKDEEEAETKVEQVADLQKELVAEKEEEQAEKEVEKGVELADTNAKQDAENELSKEEETKVVDESDKATLSTAPVDAKQVLPEHKKPSDATTDDDVVILDDEDDIDERTPTATSEKKEETSAVNDQIPAKEKPDQAVVGKSSEILSDNSDNARDGVEEKEEHAETEGSSKKTPIPSEANSCSSNKSLKKKHDKNSEHPPAKRMRLSEGEASSELSSVTQSDTKSNAVDEDEVMEVTTKGDEDSKSLKRVLSTESVSSDVKKPKTQTDPAKEEKLKNPEKYKVEVKPLAMYPPPKLDTLKNDVSLDFLRRFKKSIHKMTKFDLEELVLQKIVEAIVHKSEFSEMRDLIEKQEKIISGHRTKITELTKQFRDLEMVHHRVLKDLDTKNSQFIMPVKITRAVGLQVFFPSKKNEQSLQYLLPASAQTTPPPIARSMTPQTVLNASAPEKPSFSSPVATSSNAVTSTTTSTKQSPSVLNNIQPQPAAHRRGCVQKLTPLRPDTPRNSPLNRSVPNNAASPSSTAPAPTAPNMKLLNRTLVSKNRITSPAQSPNVSITSTPPQPVVQPVGVPAAPMAKPKAPMIPTTWKNNKLNKNLPQANESDPQSIAQPLPAAATIVPTVIPHLTVANTAITVKPTTRPVIDLTDEDDGAPAPPPSPASVSASGAPSSSANTQPTRGPYKVSVIPQHQLQQPKPNPPKQTPIRPMVAIAPRPIGVASRQIPPTRHRHPAPLPNQPIHSSNPGWKLPPARPTIRISNLESGIVISWTMEDAASDKFAESTSYQIYAYQETSGPPLVESWRHVGDVKAMLLPMAVTLTQFQEGQRYYFAVRAVDSHGRCGPFSFAKTWS